MTIKKLILFSVSAREKGRTWGYEEVLVVAENIREARVKGVLALEKKGLINRRDILDTDIYDKESEVYQWENSD